MKTLKIKAGVELHEETFRTPAVTRIISVAMSEAPDDYSPTITSGCEPGVNHKPNSAHWTGKALDWRIRDLTASPAVWADRMKMALGNNYFVLLENDHIHVQLNQ